MKGVAGPAVVPDVGPAAVSRCSTAILTDQSAMTSATSRAAAGTAALALSARHAMASVPATSSTKVDNAAASWWVAIVRRAVQKAKAARAADEIASIRPGSAG